MAIKPPFPPRLIELFESKVVRGDRCWSWDGSLSVDGYPTLSYKDQTFLAHRISWMHENGPVPEDRPMILHRCDNPVCARPEHLYAGTAKDNAHDLLARGGKGFGPKHVYGSPNSKVRKTIDLERGLWEAIKFELDNEEIPFDSFSAFARHVFRAFVLNRKRKRTAARRRAEKERG